MSLGPLASYLADGSRLQVIASYLRHEAAKHDGRMHTEPLDDVGQRTSDWHRAILARARASLAAGPSVDDLLGALTVQARWVLFHAVSFGCLRKDLQNCVAHPGFSWRLERRPLRELMFESRIGPLVRYPGSPVAFAAAINLIERSDAIDNDVHDVTDPLIGRPAGAGVLIHDGNGRLLTLAYAVVAGTLPDTTAVDIWVGQPRGPATVELAAYEAALSTLFAKGSSPA